jgi:peptide/nickel transport system permease protein
MDLSYLIKRLLLFFPVLFILSLIAFGINKYAPGSWVPGADQEDTYLPGNGNSQVKAIRKRLGLDLPVFYFSLGHLAQPDTLESVQAEEREVLERLLLGYGSWPYVNSFYNALKALEEAALHASNEQAARLAAKLKSTDDPEVISYTLNILAAGSDEGSLLRKRVEETTRRFADMSANASVWKTFIPVIRFHKENQYHRWLFGDGNWLTSEGYNVSKGIIRGDFGYSLISKRPVGEILFPRLKWSMLLIFLSFFPAVAISIPLGVAAASKKGSLADKLSSVILLVLSSVPAFWAGTMLLLLFANPWVLAWFPPSGIMPAEGYPGTMSLPEKILATLPYLVLPTICYTYGSIAYLSKMIRSSMLEELGKDYIRTARVKGLPPKRVIYRHAFRNALLPAITVFANVFPAAVGGSVIIEGIFSIPGMGLEILKAAEGRDYPMITAIFLLSGVFTMTAYLIADFFYTLADPRITLR